MYFYYKLLIALLSLVTEPHNIHYLSHQIDAEINLKWLVFNSVKLEGNASRVSQGRGNGNDKQVENGEKRSAMHSLVDQNIYTIAA